MISRRTALLLASIALTALATSCGGGGGGGGGSSGASGGGGGSAPTLTITTISLPNGIQGQSYSTALAATGGAAPYHWTMSGQAIPGLQLSADGVLLGSPSAAGIWDETTYKVQDSANPPQSASVALTLLTVAPLVIQTTTFPTGGTQLNVGVDLIISNSRFSATGGLGNLAWSLVPGSGSLPPGIVLSLSGGLSGFPTSAGTFSFTIQVTDTEQPPQTATQLYSVTVGDRLVVRPSDGYYFQAVVTKPFQGAFQTFGGRLPYTWSLDGASQLPDGLLINSATGIVSGVPVPVEIGHFTPPIFRVDFTTLMKVTDSASPPQSVQFTMYLHVNQVFSFSGASLPDGAVGQFYGATVPTSGGVFPYSAQIISGSLPNGVNVQGSSTQLAGTPTAAGASAFTVQVTDSEVPPVALQRSFTIRVNPRLMFSGQSLTPGLVGLPYSYQFQAAGGLPPLHWSFSPYSVDHGWISLDAVTGILSGTPVQPFNNQIIVTVADSATPPQSVNGNVFINVLGKLIISTSALPVVAPNTTVNLKMGAAGGTGQYTWTQLSGGLPAGLQFSSNTGSISGQTAQTGIFTLTIRATDTGPPAQTSDPATLQLNVAANLGRNNSPAAATAVSNGTYQASISPVADPPTGVASPDSDYYKITAAPGSTVTIAITAQALTPPSPLDSVLEMVDSANNRLALCTSSPTNTSGPFTQPCVNDDLQQGVSTDSKLILQVPGGNPGPLTFYAHVLDFYGNARPDFLYTITVSGAN